MRPIEHLLPGSLIALVLVGNVPTHARGSNVRQNTAHHQTHPQPHAPAPPPTMSMPLLVLPPYDLEIEGPKNAEGNPEEGRQIQEDRPIGKRQWFVRLWNDPAATVTAALVVLTVPYVVFASFQARAGVIAANAAKKSAETADRALRELERPFVLVSSVKSNMADAIAEVISEPPRPRVKITIKNFGRTPAIIETLGSRIRLSGDDSLLPVMDAQDLVLGPGDIHEFETTYDGAYGQGIAYQIRGGFVTAWLAFCIKYRDIFG